jgi:hypothetical protein
MPSLDKPNLIDRFHQFKINLYFYRDSNPSLSVVLMFASL